MLLTVDDPNSNDITIHDCKGTILSRVLSYDTETRQITLLLPITTLDKDAEPDRKYLMEETPDGTITVKEVTFILHGSFAVKDGKRIPTSTDKCQHGCETSTKPPAVVRKRRKETNELRNDICM